MGYIKDILLPFTSLDLYLASRWRCVYHLARARVRLGICGRSGPSSCILFAIADLALILNRDAAAATTCSANVASDRAG